MKRAAIITGCAMLALALLSLLGNSSADSTPAAEEPSCTMSPPGGFSGAPSPDAVDIEPLHKPVTSDSSISKEEFEQLSPEGRHEIMEQFVESFWEYESAASPQSEPQSEYISLNVFGRPYMRTVTESEFFQLSGEDREKVMAETVECCRQTRIYIKDTVARARLSIADGDYVTGEAHLIAALETGRDLNRNKDGMFVTRLVGIACQKAALKEMTRLYAVTGEHGKLETAQTQLHGLDMEVEDIRAAAQQYPQ